MKFFSFENKRDIYRIHVSHTLHNVALSVISVYIPIFLLTQGFSLSKTVLFFIAFHSVGVRTHVNYHSDIFDGIGFDLLQTPSSGEVII